MRYRTTIGGRVFAVIVGLVCSVMCMGSAWWVVRIVMRGTVSVSVGRGSSRGRVSLDGWLAYMYAAGLTCLCAALALFAIAMLMAVFSRSPVAGRLAFSLIPWATKLFIPAAALAFLAVAIEVFG